MSSASTSPQFFSEIGDEDHLDSVETSDLLPLSAVQVHTLIASDSALSAEESTTDGGWWPYVRTWLPWLSKHTNPLAILDRDSLPWSQPQEEHDGVYAAAIFLSTFELHYDVLHPKFFPGPIHDALRASHSHNRPLLVYLHATHHIDTPLFCRQVLLNHRVIDFLNRNFVVWAGDLQITEAMVLSSRLQVCTFPFVGVIGSDDDENAILLDRIEGLVTAEAFVGHLNNILVAYDEQRRVEASSSSGSGGVESMHSSSSSSMAPRETESAQQREARRIRMEQDAEYQAALQADREREQRAREDAETQRRAEEARALEQQRRAAEESLRRAQAEATRAEKLARVGAEPTEQAAEAMGVELVELAIRLPDSTRLRRKFLATDTLSLVYDFVDTHQSSFTPDSYSLFSAHPRQEYVDRTQPLSDTPLPPKALLVLQPK